jgi:hypothetical protein
LDFKSIFNDQDYSKKNHEMLEHFF